MVSHLIRCIAIKYWFFKSLPQFLMPVQKKCLENCWMHHVFTLSSAVAHPLSPSFLDTYNLCHLSDVRSCASFIILFLRVFHITMSKWFFAGVWVTASFHRPPELFLVFWLISTILLSGWYWFFLFLNPPVFFVFFHFFRNRSKDANHNWYTVF